MSAETAKWIPLESNPEVLTKYMRKLGVEGGEWVDIYALDEDVLENFANIRAVILLFPISPEYDAYTKERDSSVAESLDISPDLFYMKQTIHNACGTIGMIHSLANNTDSVQLTDGTLKSFLADTKDLGPEERGKVLENTDQIAEAHKEVAIEGQTACPNPNDEVVTHFVAFIEKGGSLYELDGRRQFPVNHGETTPDTLLKDAAKVCQERIKVLECSAATEYRFSMVALSCVN